MPTMTKKNLQVTTLKALYLIQNKSLLFFSQYVILFMDRVAIYPLLSQIVFVYAVVLVKLLRMQVGVIWGQGTYLPYPQTKP